MSGHESDEFGHVSDLLAKAEVQNLIEDPDSFLRTNTLDLVNFINSGDSGSQSHLFMDQGHYIEQPEQKYYPENENFILLPPAPLNISNEEYSGRYNFEVCIIPNNGTKSPWEYSTKLNKIFVDMGNSIPVDFSLKEKPSEQLYVRATPKYSQPQFSHEGVYRCHNHEHKTDPTNRDLPPSVCQHIIRCLNINAIYLGEKTKNERLSVVIPLANPQTGTDSVREHYQFVCKSSCPGGMNRRPIEIIFTLENPNGEIYGRRSISVRICSCPKRDKTKEELEEGKNKAPQGKKRKVESPPSSKTPSLPSNVAQDNKVYCVKIVGKDNYKNLLKCAEGFLSSEVLEFKEGRKSGDVTPYKNCLQETKDLLNSQL